MTRIRLTVDGATVSDDVEPRMLLVQYLRERLGKTGTVVGCDTSNCGACTVHLDGRSVKSCNVLAVQADGHEVTTIEGLADGRRAAPDAGGVPRVPRPPVRLLHAGDDHAGVDLLNDNPNPTEEEIRHGLEGNLCRCTGYHNIVKAVQTPRSPRPPRHRPRRCERMTATEDRPGDRPRSAATGAARRTSG